MQNAIIFTIFILIIQMPMLTISFKGLYYLVRAYGIAKFFAFFRIKLRGRERIYSILYIEFRETFWS